MSRRSSPTTIETDLAIVGGGLAGLLAATALASSAHTVALIAPARRADRRTTALLGSSVDAIKQANVWPAVADLAQPLSAIRIVDATNRLIRAPEVLFKADQLGLDAFGYNIPNEPLLAALESRAAAAGVRMLHAQANRLDRSATDASIETDGGETIRARLVVAADGRSSPMRRQAGIGMAVRDSGQAALVCEFDHEHPHRDVSTEFHTEHGPFTLVPLPGARSALVWVTTSEEAEWLSALPPERLGETIEENSHAILGGITVSSAVQTFPLQSAVAERLSDNRLVLIGEAAHAVPPIGAQGFNITVRDIACLAELAAPADDPGSHRVTDAYADARRGDIVFRRGAVDLINMTLLSSALPVQLLRGAGLFALANIAPLREMVMRAGLGLSPART